MEESADAFIAVSPIGGAPELVAAVADGASSDVFAKQWARRLTEGVSSSWFDMSDRGIIDAVDALRADFNPLANGSPVDFMVENKWLERGSNSTLVAVRIRPIVGSPGAPLACGTLRVEAIAVGDSVVGSFSRDSASTFPILAVDEFSNYPNLIGSEVGAHFDLSRSVFDLAPGGVLILASDAIAKWFVGRVDDPSIVIDLVSLLKSMPTAGVDLRQVIAKDVTNFGPPELDDDLTLLVIEHSTGGS